MLMKTLSLLLILLLSFSINAQSRNDLKGPAAKNYKPWKYPKQYTGILVAQASDRAEKGPRAKNRKAWDRDVVLLEGNRVRYPKKEKLKGPAAKNRKPWDNTY